VKAAFVARAKTLPSVEKNGQLSVPHDDGWAQRMGWPGKL
jgi:hypothetical protein